MSKNSESFGLPVRPFLYTLDQLAVLINVDIISLPLFYEGRSTGFPTRPKMMTRNIAAPTEKPDWRVAENELLRWLRFKGFKVYNRDTVRY